MNNEAQELLKTFSKFVDSVKPFPTFTEHVIDLEHGYGSSHLLYKLNDRFGIHEFVFGQTKFPPHAHASHEWAFVIEGRAVLKKEGKEIPMDIKNHPCEFTPAGVEHAADFLDDVNRVIVVSIPRALEYPDE